MDNITSLHPIALGIAIWAVVTIICTFLPYIINIRARRVSLLLTNISYSVMILFFPLFAFYSEYRTFAVWWFLLETVWIIVCIVDVALARELSCTLEDYYRVSYVIHDTTKVIRPREGRGPYFLLFTNIGVLKEHAPSEMELQINCLNRGMDITLIMTLLTKKIISIKNSEYLLNTEPSACRVRYISEYPEYKAIMGRWYQNTSIMNRVMRTLVIK